MRRLVNVLEIDRPLTAEQMREHVRFRGKKIDELSREELVEALTQALMQVHQITG